MVVEPELDKKKRILQVREIPDCDVRSSGRKQGRQSLVTFKIPPEEVVTRYLAIINSQECKFGSLLAPSLIRD